MATVVALPVLMNFTGKKTLSVSLHVVPFLLGDKSAVTGSVDRGPGTSGSGQQVAAKEGDDWSRRRRRLSELRSVGVTAATMFKTLSVSAILLLVPLCFLTCLRMINACL